MVRAADGTGHQKGPSGRMSRDETDPAVSLTPLGLFCARLKRLQEAAGLTQVSLAEAAGLKKSAMSAILNGRIERRPRWNVVKKIVHTCLLHANELDKLVPPDLCEEEEWRRRYFDLEQDLDAVTLPRRGTQGAAEPTVAPVRECDPFHLGVHHALPPTGTGSLAESPESLTPYLQREHDKELHAALHQAAAGGPAAFAVLAGDSSTGKTRALYEALCNVIPDWPLLRPADADELLDLLHKGRFRTGTVLWLNETQRYLYGTSGAQVASLLRRTLAATDGAVAVGALWRRPYLGELTALGKSPDEHAAARALLDGPRTHHITVPPYLTGHQQQELAALAHGDKRLRAALAASGPDGDVIQHLTGGPELLHAYTSGGLFTQVEHALITAALDARRLGHQGPIPASLLAAAADGYLRPRQRPGHADWATSALTGLTTGVRADRTRTDIRNVLTPLKQVRARSGDAETGYEPDDYLYQHTRRPRQTCLGPRQLWDALVKHTTSPDDLERLGNAAIDRGLYRHAALLWKQAITAGNTRSVPLLLSLLHALDCNGVSDAADWVAVHAPLDPIWSVTRLLGELRKAGEGQAVSTLAARAAAGTALDNPAGASPLNERVTGDYFLNRGVTGLLEELRQAGEGQAVSTLAARAAKHAALHDARDVTGLLWALRQAGEGQAVSTLAARAAKHAALHDPGGVAELVKALRQAGEGQAVSTLAARAAKHAALHDAGGVAELVKALRQAGEGQAVSTLAARAAKHAALHDPGGVAELVKALRQAGEGQAVSTLAARAAKHAALDLPRGASPLNERVTGLLRALRKAGEGQAVSTLAARAAKHAALDDLREVDWLLEELRKAGEGQAVSTLAGRAAKHAALDDPWVVAWLLDVLREARADEAVSTLAGRAAADAALDDPWYVAWLLRALREAGEGQAVSTLAGRAAADAALDDPRRVAWLLWALREAGEGQAVSTLAARAAKHAALDHPGGVAELLRALRVVGEAQAVSTLAARAAADAALDHPGGVARLLTALRKADEGQAVSTLAARAAKHAALDHPGGVAELVKALREARADEAVSTLAARAADAALDDPWYVAWLVEALRVSGEGQAVSTLAGRAAKHAALDQPGGVARLLRALRVSGEAQAVSTLAGRAAADATLDDPRRVAWLLRALREAGEGQAVSTLAARAAKHAALDHPGGVAELVKALREARADEAVSTLAGRAAADAALDHPGGVARLLRALRKADEGQAVSTLAARAAKHAALHHPGGVARLLKDLRKARADEAVSTLAARAANAGLFIFCNLHLDMARQSISGREPDGAPSVSWHWPDLIQPLLQGPGLWHYGCE